MFIKTILKKIRYGVLWCVRYHKFHSFGSHSVMKKPLRICGGHNVDIGDYCYIFTGLRLETVEKPSWNDQQFTPHIQIGNHVEIHQNVHIVSSCDIKIGDYVTIGCNSMINDTSHGFVETDKPICLQELSNAPIEIGEGTQIGMSVCILPGIKIGKNCVIGANTVINKNVPDYTIVSSAKVRKVTLPVE